MNKILICLLILNVSFNFFGQKLIKYKQSDCSSNSYPEYIKNRIVSKEFRNDTLTFSVGFVANCCLYAKPTVTLKSDSLILEIVNASETYCACDCCFEIEFMVSDIKDTNFNVFLKKTASNWFKGEFVGECEKLEFSKEKFIFPSFEDLKNFKICNKLNEKGHKVGLWEVYYETTNQIKSKIYYSEKNSEKEMFEWYFHYDEKGVLNSVCVNSKSNLRTCIDGEDYFKLMKE